MIKMILLLSIYYFCFNHFKICKLVLYLPSDVWGQNKNFGPWGRAQRLVFSTSGRIGFRYWKKLWIRVWIGFGYWQPMSRILSGINFQFKTLGIIGFLLQILDMALLFHKSENVCNTSFVLLVCLIQISKRKNDHLCLEFSTCSQSKLCFVCWPV